MTDLRLGITTLADYACPPVRIFSKAVIRAYVAMRRSQEDVYVSLPVSLFPTQVISDMVPFVGWSNDDTRPVVNCQNRLLYMRPVFRQSTERHPKKLHNSLIGVDPEFHGGEWLSLYLVQLFLVGDD